MRASGYIVVFDDEQGACWPMGWDADCAGALCAMHNGKLVAFSSRADARKAIKVSTAYAKLLQAQGLPVNEDFLGGAKCVKVLPCVSGTTGDAA